MILKNWRVFLSAGLLRWTDSKQWFNSQVSQSTTKETPFVTVSLIWKTKSEVKKQLTVIKKSRFVKIFIPCCKLVPKQNQIPLPFKHDKHQLEQCSTYYQFYGVPLNLIFITIILFKYFFLFILNTSVKSKKRLKLIHYLKLV